MDQHNPVNNVLDLVCLQMADHMEAQILGKDFIFVPELLRFIFSKIHNSRRHDLLDHLHRLCLAHSNQKNVLSFTAASVAGCLDSFFHIFQVNE